MYATKPTKAKSKKVKQTTSPVISNNNSEVEVTQVVQSSQNVRPVVQQQEEAKTPEITASEPGNIQPQEEIKFEVSHIKELMKQEEERQAREISFTPSINKLTEQQETAQSTAFKESSSNVENNSINNSTLTFQFQVDEPLFPPIIEKTDSKKICREKLNAFYNEISNYKLRKHGKSFSIQLTLVIIQLENFLNLLNNPNLDNESLQQTKNSINIFFQASYPEYMDDYYNFWMGESDAPYTEEQKQIYKKEDNGFCWTSKTSKDVQANLEKRIKLIFDPALKFSQDHLNTRIELKINNVPVNQISTKQDWLDLQLYYIQQLENQLNFYEHALCIEWEQSSSQSNEMRNLIHRLYNFISFSKISNCTLQQCINDYQKLNVSTNVAIENYCKFIERENLSDRFPIQDTVQELKSLSSMEKRLKNNALFNKTFAILKKLPIFLVEQQYPKLCNAQSNHQVIGQLIFNTVKAFYFPNENSSNEFKENIVAFLNQFAGNITSTLFINSNKTFCNELQKLTVDISNHNSRNAVKFVGQIIEIEKKFPILTPAFKEALYLVKFLALNLAPASKELKKDLQTQKTEEAQNDNASSNLFFGSQ